MTNRSTGRKSRKFEKSKFPLGTGSWPTFLDGWHLWNRRWFPCHVNSMDWLNRESEHKIPQISWENTHIFHNVPTFPRNPLRDSRGTDPYSYIWERNVQNMKRLKKMQVRFGTTSILGAAIRWQDTHIPCNTTLMIIQSDRIEIPTSSWVKSCDIWIFFFHCFTMFPTCSLVSSRIFPSFSLGFSYVSHIFL